MGNNCNLIKLKLKLKLSDDVANAFFQTVLQQQLHSNDGFFLLSYCKSSIISSNESFSFQPQI